MTIRVFEPALCCNTGVCGTDVDENLVAFSADLQFLKENSVDIERHNMANDPMAFVEDATAKAFIEAAGSDGLPLTIVDGITVKTGSYPSRDELVKFAKLTVSVPEGATLLTMAGGDSDGACCGGSGCC
jgi:hypothetical protein